MLLLSLGTAAKAKSSTPERTLTAITEKAPPTGLDNLDAGITRQVECLALNLYQEARGTSEAEIMAVGFTTRNRVKHSDAQDYCATIWEKGQYTWTKRSIAGMMPREKTAWGQMIAYAAKIVTTDIADTTHGSTSFYERRIKTPRWALKVAFRTTIGHHVFVRMA